MRVIARQNIKGYYPVELAICDPLNWLDDEPVYLYGKWYVSCGGEGHYTDSMKESCEWFGRLVNFAMNEAKTQ